VADDTLTLALDGDVTLPEFADAVLHFNHLVEAISREERADHVAWIVADLEYSSALTTVKGVAADSEPPEIVEDEIRRVIQGYLRVGKALEAGSPVPYEGAVAKEARAITSVINGTVKAVRFETAEDEARIAAPPKAPTAPPDSIATRQATYGAVEGRVQTLSSRGRLRFTLYDTLHDKAVSCYLTEGQEEKMRDVWGKRAVVEGRIMRDPESGRPLSVREITGVEILRELGPGKFLSLAGASPSPDLRAEDAIRRLRDAG
jgi:hypothetical protein